MGAFSSRSNLVHPRAEPAGVLLNVMYARGEPAGVVDFRAAEPVCDSRAHARICDLRTHARICDLRAHARICDLRAHTRGYRRAESASHRLLRVACTQAR